MRIALYTKCVRSQRPPMRIPYHTVVCTNNRSKTYKHFHAAQRESATFKSKRSALHDECTYMGTPRFASRKIHRDECTPAKFAALQQNT